MRNLTQRDWLHWILLIGVVLCIALIADPSFALDNKAASFSCSNGKASGSLYISGASCPTSLGIDNFFTFLICNMEKLSSSVMASMYCGIIQTLRPTVWAAITLAITLYGVGFMTGMVQVARGGAALFVIKIAFISSIALNADILIGVGYNFFMSAMTSGTTIALNSMGNNAVQSQGGMYQLLDAFIAKWFAMATDMLKGGLNKDLAAGVSDRCNNAIFAVLGTMLIASPTLGYFGLVLIVRILMMVFRAMFGYVYAMLGITFLMVLSPIFLCFFLFTTTRQFFDKWIAYLGGFALQAVLLFTFMTFVLSLNATSLPASMKNIVMFNAEAVTGQSLRFPWEYCTVCDFKVVEKGNSTKELSLNDSNLLANGELQCVNHKGEQGVTDPQGRLPTKVLNAASPKASSAETAATLKIGFSVLIALFILAWLVERLLWMIPTTAQKLASYLGANSVPQLGGEGGKMGNTVATTMPGEGLANDFGAGFRYGYGSQTNTATGIVEGVKQGISGMVSGKTAPMTAGGKEYQGGANMRNAAGMKQRIADWLTDPARMS